MATTADHIADLEKVGFDKCQAVAIVSLVDAKAVTRDYLDSKIEGLFTRLMAAMIGVAALALVIERLIPR